MFAITYKQKQTVRKICPEFTCFAIQILFEFVKDIYRLCGIYLPTNNSSKAGCKTNNQSLIHNLFKQQELIIPYFLSKVFHICAGGPEGELFKYSFLCPNGTIFNQEKSHLKTRPFSEPYNFNSRKMISSSNRFIAI